MALVSKLLLGNVSFLLPQELFLATASLCPASQENAK
jgi:hypothetical protein